MSALMRVVVKVPDKPAELREIQNTLEALQSAVGGYIEVLRFAEDCAIIVNEEGKLQNLPPNMWLCGDVLCGNVVFVGVVGDEFCGLSDFLVEILSGWIGEIKGVEE